MRTKNIVYALLILALSNPFSAAAQQTAPQPASNTEDHLSIALTSLDYPVTFGDQYRLSYRQTGGTVVNSDLLVDESLVLDLGSFGKYESNGKTFIETKREVEALIVKKYPFSQPYLSIIMPGTFRVKVSEGTSPVQYVQAWGLSRLGDIVSQLESTSYSSRRIEILTQEGHSSLYDLVNAKLLQDPGLDPLMHPGDTVILHPPAKTVEIQGEVRKPGNYEILGSEGIYQLVEVFAGGLTSQADGKRVRIDRSAGSTAESVYVSIPDAYQSRIVLEDGDRVIVRAKSDQFSRIWFEGSVTAPARENAAGDEPVRMQGSGVTGAATGQDAPASGTGGRFSYPIREGQLLSDVLQEIRGGFLPMADLSSAVLFHPNSLVGSRVDITSLLSGTDMSTDVQLSEGYRIVIPEVSTTVLVSGAVYAPGMVPYRPNAPANYYLILAGGVDPWRNDFRSCIVYDQNGNRRKKGEPIQAGDQIHVKENSLLYGLERRVPVLASVVSLSITLLTFFVLAR